MNVQLSVSAGSNTSSSSQNVVDMKLSYVAQDSTQFSTNGESMGLVTQDSTLSVGKDQLIRNIERALKTLEGPQTILDINIHEKTHDIIVRVLNKETGELIREIPPEKMLDLVAKMMEIAGILVDKKI
ncbi:flagellin [Paenibacillus sp. J45TS6]|uniref:flagellar protein FlaG n=1 Tax=Paenibacillus sp. J45TS6 TaxID=2807196 RepID=UPI001B26D72B|nr:flagellar protein FlaG [Paenibacillus sp. J45TS6]GIP42149.1 flagellin [Paenibacillus sp. J45TS6]